MLLIKMCGLLDSEVSSAELMAAWTSFTAVFGPAAVISGVVLGTLFFSDLALKITGAVVNGKGLAVYSTWAAPPIKVEIE